MSTVITFVNWAPTVQTARVTVRLSDTGRVTDYNIVLAAQQVRRIRFMGVPTAMYAQAPARFDYVYECP